MNSRKLIIGFYAGGLAFHGDTLKEASLGGSETALLYMARELAKRGHDVKVFNNCSKPGRYDGVDYFDFKTNWIDIAPIAEWDVFIASRDYTFLGHKLNSRLTGLWNHDIAGDRRNLMTNMWGADFAWCLSNFHMEQYLSVAKEIRPILYRTRNGVDMELINSVRSKVKDRQKNVYVWGSRPERGLDILLQKTWPLILKEVDPNAVLQIAGYSDIGLDLPDQIKEFYAMVEQLIVTTPNVYKVGNLTKEKWYELLCSSGMVIYPTAFPEISCINAIEAQACEIPIVTSNEFALKETVKDKHNLIDNHPRSDEYQNAFIARVKRLINNEFEYKQSQKIGREHVLKYYEWKTIAEEWEEFFWDKFKERSLRNGGRSVIKNMIYKSDLLSAKWALDHPEETGVSLKDCDDVKKDVERWLTTHHEDPELYDDGDKSNPETYVEWKKIGRFGAAIGHMQKHFGETKFSLIDIGCGTGGFLARVLESFPEQVQVMGYDFSERLVKRAQLLIKKNFPSAGDPTNFIFAEDFMNLDVLENEEDKSDCAFAGEWLEHQIDLHGALERMEKWVKKDGFCVITIPSGPWEAISYKKNISKGLLTRDHVSHFEFRDIEELFHDKNFTMEFFPISVSPLDGSLLGNWIVSWVADGKSFGKINYLRKFQTMRPYQHISACLITKNEENNIVRALKSIHLQVDEIIVLDTGSTDDTVALAKKYADKVEIVEWPDDFSEARNMSIALADKNADWIYWMDADEELEGRERMRKYLNNDLFMGYVITQNHLTLDMKGVKPDVPVRLYRNNIGIKFYGAIHEHCEFAMDKPIDPVLILPDVKIVHYGYMTEAIRRWKCRERNFGLLKKDREKYPSRLLGIPLMMRDYLNASQWEIEETKGQMTLRIAQWLREIVRLHRQYFWHKEDHMYHEMAFSFYQRALAALGHNGIPLDPSGEDVPFEVIFAMGGSVGGMREPERVTTLSYWFGDREEFSIFINSRVNLLSNSLKLLENKRAK